MLFGLEILDDIKGGLYLNYFLLRSLISVFSIIS